MDDKGYAFTPMVFLLFIPIMIMAIAYGDIANEANLLADITIGGDVTYTAATNIFQSIEKGASDAGRNAAYNATRLVIDNSTTNSTKIFFDSNTSKPYIKQLILNSINNHVITTCRSIENETGRQIYINNIPISNYTNATFFSSDINITQTEPFGFFVKVKEGIPIKIVQKDQSYEVYSPPISSYVTIEGLEDPYVWVNTKYRTSNIIYKYPYHTYSAVYGHDYFFDEVADKQEDRLYQLWNCLNGTDNPSNITPRSYYFTDPYGLSFFDRLENKTNSSSTSDPSTRMSTFIIGDPLLQDHARSDISRLDHEYFASVVGTWIRFGNDPMLDPMGSVFYLSTFYKNFFDLKNQY